MKEAFVLTKLSSSGIGYYFESNGHNISIQYNLNNLD